MAEDPPANPQPNAKSNVRWTDAQRAAIEHLGGDLIVSAAAGSGKTAVLAERCARLVCSMEGGEGSRCGVENLLVLTFTEAAAGEMRTRIGEAVADRLRCAGKESRLDPDEERWLRRQAAMIDRASISTLHAFCARVLRQHFHEAGVDPAFEVMDEDEARLLQDEVLDGLIARWHRLAPQDIDGAVTGGGFDSFFEAHAQGRESECARIILQVYRMLATTEDPDAFKRSTRRIYGEDAHETVRQYSQQTLMGRLKLARLVARRAYDEVRPLLDSDQTMVKGLQDAVLVIQDAIELLEDKGTKAWPFIVTQLTYKWMKLNRIDSISDFAGLKDRTWEEVKQVFKETAKLFTRDPAQMVQELKSLLPFLETLLAMVEQFERTYTDAKRADNRLDFADLEQLALNLLKSPTSHAAAELRERFVHVLVDEFQDINPLQAALLDAVRHPARFNAAGNLFVVGEFMKSFYVFGLADR
jgi:ATP-dependent helicase/nuclease subunit A